MTDAYKTEVCAASAADCRAAELGGADRVELCAALSEGGLTPSAGEIAQVRALTEIRLHVLIRPRSGDFLYSSAELAAMEYDIAVARDLGADGIVAGCLTPCGEVDEFAMRRLMRAASGLSVTFHRAFDMAADPLQALEQIVGLGCDRILTSGQRPTAEQGIPILHELAERAAGRIIIMPGCGINEANIGRIALLTGAREFHFSAREWVPSKMTVRNPHVQMGTAGRDEYGFEAASERRVKSIVKALHDAAAPR